MGTMVMNKEEFQSIRREIAELRGEIARLRRENPISYRKCESSSTTSVMRLQDAIAVQLLHQGEVAAVERRVRSLEQRVSNLEEAHRTRTFLN